MFVPGPRPKVSYRIGYCTHPAVGRVVRDDDACLFFVRDGGRGFDENAALRAFERVQQGREAAHVAGPRIVNLDALRERNRRDNAWSPRRRRKA